MIVYIEDCIIENFFVTLFLLLCLNKIFVNQCGKLKLFLISLLSGIVATFYPLLQFNGLILILFKLCFGVVIVYLYSGKTKMLAKYITFIFLTALYAGINILVYYFVYGNININDNFASYILIFMMYLIYYLINSCISLLKKNLTISNFVYNVKITNKNKEYIITAFLDSGNTLLDSEDNSPVFIINYKLFNRLYKEIDIEDILSKNYKDLINPHYLQSGFASGSGNILVFTIDKIEILNKDIELKDAKLGLVYSKFNKNFNCNMLLNINAFCKN